MSLFIFVLVHQLNGSIAKYQYEGQSLDTVTALQDSRVQLGEELSYDIVDEPTFNSVSAVPDK